VQSHRSSNFNYLNTDSIEESVNEDIIDIELSGGKGMMRENNSLPTVAPPKEGGIKYGSVA
jgi:hypothetical protein